MPNWCTNRIKIADEYRNVILNSKGEVDFNIILPMPDELRVTAGGSDERNIYIYLSEKGKIPLEEVMKNPDIKAPLSGYDDMEDLKALFTQGYDRKIEKFQEELKELDASALEKGYQSGKILVDNYHKYGYINWYDWCSNIWGTKWNASDTHDDGTSIAFSTAWGLPYGWVQKLAALNIPFEIEWDVDQGGYGKLISKDGQLISVED